MKYTLIFSLCLFSFSMIAQHNIPIAVAIPQSNKYLDNNQLKKLGKKTKRLITQNGLAAGGSQQFFIYPEFDLLEEETADFLAGPKTTVEIEVGFTLQQRNNNIIFNSTSINAKGFGKNRKAAINNAIKNLKTRQLKSFVNESVNKLKQYYQKNCEQLIRQAELASDLKNYEKAMSLLYAIPPGTTCYERANDVLINVYFFYQEQHCKKWILKAETLLAKNEYKQALSILSLVDPNSSCEAKLNDLISRAAKKVDAEERKYWDALQERYHNEVMLEELRIESISSILTTYYENQPDNNQQFILIK